MAPPALDNSAREEPHTRLARKRQRRSTFVRWGTTTKKLHKLVYELQRPFEHDEQAAALP